MDVLGGERSTKTQPVTASAVCWAAFKVKLLSSIMDKDKPPWCTGAIDTFPTWRPDQRLEPIELRSKCGLKRPNNNEEDEGPVVLELVLISNISVEFVPLLVDVDDVVNVGKGTERVCEGGPVRKDVKGEKFNGYVRNKYKFEYDRSFIFFIIIRTFRLTQQRKH